MNSIDVKMELVNEKSHARSIALETTIITLLAGYFLVFNGLITRVNSSSFIFSAVSVFIAPIFAGFIIIMYQNNLSEKILTLLESFIMIGGSFSVGIFLLTRTMYGECETLSFIESFHCNPGFLSHGLPQDTG